MMNVLRDGRSERGTARVGKRHDLKTVRWYVLTLPTTGVARRDRIITFFCDIINVGGIM